MKNPFMTANDWWLAAREDLAIIGALAGMDAGYFDEAAKAARRDIENITKEMEDILLAAMAAGVPASSIVMTDPVTSWDKRKQCFLYKWKVGFLPSGGAF